MPQRLCVCCCCSLLLFHLHLWIDFSYLFTGYLDFIHVVEIAVMTQHIQAQQTGMQASLFLEVLACRYTR
uniref:Uncharacterized protein n=1 Tax=Kalanchoe fedtschenkoi TaxID=63787 RepID=A0A7N0T3F7_KALFE